MYAVIKSGGKQHTVHEGERFTVEKLELGEGDVVEFDVLMLGNDDGVKVGTPLVPGAKVTASVTGQGRHKKITIVKFRRRKHHRKQMGHRQYFTELTITSITAG